MWHTEKVLNFEQEHLNKRLRTQDVLLEIERAHSILYDNKKKSEKRFDGWLNTQGFIKPNSKTKQTASEPDLSVKPKESPKANKKLMKAKTEIKPPDFEESEIKMSKARFDESREKLTARRQKFNSTAQSDLSNLLQDSQDYGDLKQQSEVLNEATNSNQKINWDYSTKVGQKTYVKNLDDFYPRDPYTMLPPDDEMLLLHHQLYGLTLDEVKEFMKKSLTERAEIIKAKMEKIDKAKTRNGKNKKSTRSSAVSSVSFKSQRPVYYKPKNMLDYEAKAKKNEDFNKINVAGFMLSDDTTAFCYKESKKFVENPKESKRKTINGLNKAVKNSGEDQYKKIISSNFSSELYDFMTTKNGKLNPKYDKVFIC